MLWFVNKYNQFFTYINFQNNFFFFNLFKSLNVITHYYAINDILWQEGLLIDFLQKKTSDNWIKKFLIISSNLFNERLVFDRIIKFYLTLVIWPLNKYNIFDIHNVAALLHFIFIYFFLFFFIFFYLINFMFL